MTKSTLARGCQKGRRAGDERSVWIGSSDGVLQGGGGGKQSLQSLLELSEGLACAQLPPGLPAALLLVDHTHTGSTSVLGPGPALHCYVGALYS